VRLRRPAFPRALLRAALLVSTLHALALVASGCRGDAKHVIEPADPAARRTTESGDVIGGESRYGAHAWRGIPYAKPPVGALRWRAPQPAEPWTEAKPTIAPGAPCMQYGSRFGGVTDVEPGTPAGSED